MSKRFLVTETVKRTYVVTLTDEHLTRAKAMGIDEEMCAADAVDDPGIGAEVLFVGVEDDIEAFPEHECDLPAMNATQLKPQETIMTKTDTILPAIGQPFQGGFLAAVDYDRDGNRFALIVAPKAEGEARLKFRTRDGADAGARSLRDGFANSEAMNDDDHPAAQFCRGLRIGGHDDWYLPSRHEAWLLAENLLPGASYVPEQTTAEAFREGGAEAFERAWYWTSTECTPGSAWIQLFYYGYQVTTREFWDDRVRAVRKYQL